MNRRLSLALAVLAGIGMGACFSIRPAQAAETTLYGTVATPGLEGSFPVTIELRDPATDSVVAKRSAEATVRSGRYMANLGEGIPDGLYVVHMAAANGAPLQAASFVELQTNSPGTKQTGNVNISGTLLAGKIGVPTVNAGAMLNAVGTGGVIGVRGQSDGTGVVGASGAAGGTGVSGVVTANSGTGSGVAGFNSSPEGFGVRGNGGAGIGVRGQTNAPLLPAVLGLGIGLGGHFKASEQGSFGVKGESTGFKGRGVLGTGEFGVVGSGKIGVQGEGTTGVGGLGEAFGGSFEATGIEGIALKAETSAQFGLAIDARASGETSRGIFASGTDAGGVFLTGGDGSTAVIGDARGNGIVFGGDFTSSSPEGRGVRGKASATSGSNFGGWFTSSSPSGTGAIGTVNSATGNTVGLVGTVNSVSGKGVVGEATAATGTNFGGDFVSNSTQGSGVRGRSTATSGFTKAGEFTVASPSGTALLAIGTSATGNPSAIQGNTAAPGGNVSFFNNSAGTGNATGVRSQVASLNAKAMVAQHFATNTNVEIGSPNGAIMYDKGHINKKFGGSLFTMSPIAYGFVNANGTRAGGTNNWTVVQSQSQTKAYFINLTGQDLVENNFVCHVTQYVDSVSDPRFIAATTFDSQGPNTVTVSWTTPTGAFASTKFHFIVYGQVPVATQPPLGPP